MPWEKQPAIPGQNKGCLCCGNVRSIYPLSAIFAVGFGASWIQRDGDTVHDEHPEDETHPILADFEAMAAEDPDHDWRMCRVGPFYRAEYQRHGTGKWVLIRLSEGFA